MGKRFAILIGVAAAGVMAFAAPASAVTIGQTGGLPGTRDGIQNIKADVTYAVPPGGGTITSFSFESVSDKAGQQLDFLVLHPPARG